MGTINRMVLTFLLNSLWDVTLVAGVATLCVCLLRNTPARYRHLLWVLALGLSVLLPLWSDRDFEGARHGVLLPDSFLLSTQVAPRPEKTRASEGAERAPALTGRKPEGLGYARGWWVGDFLRKRSYPISLSPVFANAVLALYGLSLLCHSARLWRAWRRTKAIQETAFARKIPESMALIADRCQAALGLENVPILCSSQIAGPLTLGVRQPAIILPENLFRAEASEELTLALCHEMAHIRRRDFLLNLLYELLYLPVSFHPAAMLLKRRISETRELACDEMAAGLFISAPSYARALVSLARSMASLSRLGHTLGVFDANILEERIMRLSDKRPRASTRLANFLLLAALLGLAVSCIAASAFSLSVRRENNPSSADAEKWFIGTWHEKIQGIPAVTVVVRKQGMKLGGTVSLVKMSADDNGQNVEAAGESHDWQITSARVDGQTLTLTGDDQEGYSNQFQIKLSGERKAEFILVGVPPPPGGLGTSAKRWVITKDPEDPQNSLKDGGVSDGVPGGILGGVPGGISGAVPGGIPRGIRTAEYRGQLYEVAERVHRIADEPQKSQADPNAAKPSEPGSISGVVYDPSGARVPEAIVSIRNDDTGQDRAVVTNDTGDFSFRGLPEGPYHLDVEKSGFTVYQKHISLDTDKPSNVFEVVLEPGRPMVYMEVTAKALPGAAAASSESGPQRIRVGGLIEATKLAESVKPEYPEGARARGVQGVALLEGVISKEGEIIDLKVLSSPDPALSAAAMDAVKRRRYEPTLLNGEPIEVVTTIAVRFHLDSQ